MLLRLRSAPRIAPYAWRGYSDLAKQRIVDATAKRAV
jgi:hypothetical protein